MNLLPSVLLGALQGLTEFLPVSSSGHLVLVQEIIPGFSQPGVLYDSFLHGGTLLAVLVFFRKEIVKLTSKYLSFLIIGSIPVVLVGILFSNLIELLFINSTLVGFALIVTGIFNLFTDRVEKKGKNLTQIKALYIGLFQALAIIPGISRSGVTIFASVNQGIKREKAAQFSFLLSVPAIVGAILLQFIKHGLNGLQDYSFFIIGFIFSFAFGLLAIYLVMEFVKRKKFVIFSFYCVLIGVFVLIF